MGVNCGGVSFIGLVVVLIVLFVSF